METLAKKIRRQSIARTLFFLLCAFLSFIPRQGYTQTNQKEIQDAFKNSYALERKADYTGAIKVLTTVYNEKSYEINLRLGWLQYQAGFFTESAAYYHKAMTLMPYSLEAKFGFVYPSAAVGNWDQVITTYQEILRIDPQNTLANYRMGSIYYGRQDYASAEKFLEKVVNLYPFDYDSNVLFAWTMLKLGKLREASVVFDRCLNMRPDDISAREGLGLTK